VKVVGAEKAKKTERYLKKNTNRWNGFSNENRIELQKQNRIRK
jgi:hypothetical protein